MCQPICDTLVASNVLMPSRCQVIYSDHVDSTATIVTWIIFNSFAKTAFQSITIGIIWQVINVLTSLFLVGSSFHSDNAPVHVLQLWTSGSLFSPNEHKKSRIGDRITQWVLWNSINSIFWPAAFSQLNPFTNKPIKTTISLQRKKEESCQKVIFKTRSVYALHCWWLTVVP